MRVLALRGGSVRSSLAGSCCWAGRVRSSRSAARLSDPRGTWRGALRVSLRRRCLSDLRGARGALWFCVWLWCHWRLDPLGGLPVAPRFCALVWRWLCPVRPLGGRVRGRRAGGTFFCRGCLADGPTLGGPGLRGGCVSFVAGVVRVGPTRGGFGAASLASFFCRGCLVDGSTLGGPVLLGGRVLFVAGVARARPTLGGRSVASLVSAFLPQPPCSWADPRGLFSAWRPWCFCWCRPRRSDPRGTRCVRRAACYCAARPLGGRAVAVFPSGAFGASRGRGPTRMGDLGRCASRCRRLSVPSVLARPSGGLGRVGVFGSSLLGRPFRSGVVAPSRQNNHGVTWFVSGQLLSA